MGALAGPTEGDVLPDLDAYVRIDLVLVQLECDEVGTGRAGVEVYLEVVHGVVVRGVAAVYIQGAVVLVSRVHVPRVHDGDVEPVVGIPPLASGDKDPDIELALQIVRDDVAPRVPLVRVIGGVLVFPGITVYHIEGAVVHPVEQPIRCFFVARVGVLVLVVLSEIYLHVLASGGVELPPVLVVVVTPGVPHMNGIQGGRRLDPVGIVTIVVVSVLHDRRDGRRERDNDEREEGYEGEQPNDS